MANKGKDTTKTTSTEAYINLGGGKAQDVTLQFADGEKVVPGWLVAHLGGPGKVTEAEFKATVKGVTYEEFTSGFHEEVAANTLNKVQSSIVQQHLRRSSVQRFFR
jgi:hypothetical protein